jgi:hypothetical protein
METKSNTVHIFQAAGLGVGPFKLHHVSGEGGKCQYCATPILWRFYLNGIDGSTFFVGSDCVMKTGDAGLMKIVDAEVKRRMAEARKVREDAKLASVKESMKDANVLAKLATLPHPNGYYARNGKTLADYASWIVKYGGKTAMLNLGKTIAKATVSA